MPDQNVLIDAPLTPRGVASGRRVDGRTERTCLGDKPASKGAVARSVKQGSNPVDNL